MTYATLMVNLELGRSNASLLKVAGDLAERFHASVIGIAARQPAQIMYTDAYIVQDLVEEDRREIEKRNQGGGGGVPGRAADADGQSRMALDRRIHAAFRLPRE
ncbi:MAG: hypothetical protein WDN49_04610 [Acetobacteraceae bacterium]